MQGIKMSKITYTYEINYKQRKFMESASIEETYTFWKEQNKKGVNIKFLYYPLHIAITGDSLEDCNKKFDKFREELFLHNPNIDELESMTWENLRKRYKGQ